MSDSHGEVEDGVVNHEVVTTPSNNLPTTNPDPKINRARVGSFNLYEITETELETLEKGSPNSLYLNFALALLSAAISFLTALLTTKIDSNRTYTAFVVFTSIGFILGLILLILWLKTKNEVSEVIKKIKLRMQ